MIRKDFFKKSVFDSTRNGFGKGLVKAGVDEDVWVATADLGGSTCVSSFKKQFPERFVQVGVAEQNLVAVSSGIASMGKVVFATSFAVFSPGRNWEQIRTTICYNNQPVIVVGSHTGLGVGEDGATHQALEDVALMRVLPNMVVVIPCDALQAEKATVALAKLKNPAYLRLNRQKSPLLTLNSSSFKIGKAQVFLDGKDLVIFSCGPIISEVLKSSVELKKKGFSVAVINVHTIKPLDEELVLKYVNKCGVFLTVEDHQIIGGLGSAISQLVIKKSKNIIGDFLGVADEFGESGAEKDLFWKYGLTSDRIITVALKLLNSKSRRIKSSSNKKQIIRKSSSKKSAIKKSART